MAQVEMFAAQANSPATELTAALTDIATTVSVLDASKLPDAPNIATIGVDETAETIKYAGKSGNTLTGVTRGFSGTVAKAWATGVGVARYFTAYDADALRQNVAENSAQLAEKALQSDLATANSKIASNTADIHANTENILANTNAITNIGSASPKGAFANLAALTAAFPTGNNNVYVTTDDQKWNYWNGLGAWVNGGVFIAAPELAAGVVKPKNIANTIISKNLIIPSNWSYGQLLTSPGTTSSNAGYDTTDFIEISPSTSYTLSSSGVVVRCYYDATFTLVTYSLIAAVDANAGVTHTTYSNIKYVRFSIAKAASYAQYELGSTKTSYEPYFYKFPTGQRIDEIVTARGPEDALIDRLAKIEAGLRIGDKTIKSKHMAILDVSVNLLDLHDPDLVTGKYIASNGVITTSSQLFYSGKIYVKPGDVLIMPVASGISDSTCGAYYDVNDTFIAAAAGVTSGSTRTVTFPANYKIAYVRINHRVDAMSTLMIVKGTTYPTEYIPHTVTLNPYIVVPGQNPLYGKRFNIIGDSMTAGHTLPFSQSWASLIAARNGMTVNNYAMNGKFLTAYTTESGSLVAYGGSTVTNPGVVDAYTAMGDADYIGVYIATNDIGYTIAIGTDSDTTKTTVKGATNILCDGLITKYPAQKIFFITPNKVSSGALPYVQAIIDVCKKYSIPVFDGYSNIGVNYNNAAQAAALVLDGPHLNAAGMQYVSTKYEAFMRML